MNTTNSFASARQQLAKQFTRTPKYCLTETKKIKTASQAAIKNRRPLSTKAYTKNVNVLIKMDQQMNIDQARFKFE